MKGDLKDPYVLFTVEKTLCCITHMHTKNGARTHTKKNDTNTFSASHSASKEINRDITTVQYVSVLTIQEGRV